jgi:hypothetical protein
MRSYSSIFSSSSFYKLLKDDDYSFLDLKITRYDSSKVGREINTYYDYLKYVYYELSKNYKNEYIYKNTFLNKLLIDKYGIKNTIAINEFRVGNSIADIVLFNGSSKAFEIKTELDTDIRLKGQLQEYTKIFNKCYIITHESLIEKHLKLSDNIGIIVLKEKQNSLIMKEIRKAKRNFEVDAETLIRSIRTNEYQNIVKNHFGKLPQMDSFNMFEICKEKMKQIPNKQLHKLFIEEIKKRKSNTEILKSFDYILRQLFLAMNIDDKVYNEFDNKLNINIRFN